MSAENCTVLFSDAFGGQFFVFRDLITDGFERNSKTGKLVFDGIDTHVRLWNPEILGSQNQGRSRDNAGENRDTLFHKHYEIRSSGLSQPSGFSRIRTGKPD